MDNSMNMPNQVTNELTLPDNNEEVIHMLGLDAYADCNTGKLVDDIVRKLDLDAFTLTASGVPAAAIGFEGIQGIQQVVGNPHEAYQQNEGISYVDMSPLSQHGFENSPYDVSEAYSPPASPVEVKSVLPGTSVETQDTRNPAGGKTSKRRRELKPKLYEREEPLSDPEEEKKRQNAINAKKNRDKQKMRVQELEELVRSLTAERDTLATTNSKLKRKCDAFESQLKTVCKQFNVPVIILPQD